jgi:hypothetical protein
MEYEKMADSRSVKNGLNPGGICFLIESRGGKVLNARPSVNGKKAFLAVCLAFCAVRLWGGESEAAQRSRPPMIKMEFKLHVGANFMVLNDLNEGWKGVLEGREISPYITLTSGRYRPAGLGFEAGVEGIVYLESRLGVGFEADFLRVTRTSEAKFSASEHAGPVSYYRESVVPEITAVPLILKTQMTLFERRRWKGTIQAGAGLWIGRVRIEHPLENESSSNTLLEEWRARGVSLGAQGGLGFEYRFNQKLALALDVLGRYAKLRAPKGDYVIGGSVTSDAFMWICYGGAFDSPWIVFDRSKPADDYFRGYRKADIDLSGFSIRIGLKIAVLK